VGRSGSPSTNGAQNTVIGMERQLAGVGGWIRVPHRGRRALAAVATVGLTFVALRAGGGLDGTDTALQAMGFDVDRAHLLTALTIEAVVVSAGVLLTRAAGASSGAGMLVGGAIFARTFVDETVQAAAIPSGGTASFDLVGWLITVLTLVGALLIVAWASATLSLHVRAAGLASAADIRAIRAGTGDRRRLLRPAGAAASIAILLVVLPAFGDMVNYAPDVRMRVGGPAEIGLTGAPADSTPGSATDWGASVAGASLPPAALTQPAILDGRDPNAKDSLLSAARPWSGWQPTGMGTVSTVTFPAPWVGGSTSSLTVDIYLPPGYATSTHPDPVLYEVPNSLDSGWSKSVAVTSILDQLIDSGRLPPTIAVFIPEVGGPFADAECANSYDGREWIDRFITSTVVPWVDSHERTIPIAEARAVMGFSQGGFCAAALELRHPDVFADAIALSGYYQAGLQSGQTAEAARIFGTSAAFRAASSPDVLARRLPSSVDHTLFVELNANPSEAIYGPQYLGFASALDAAGIPVALFPSATGHAWDTVRDEMPTLLATLAQRWSAAGIFR
jgi:enterochelin esterase-like enzyme